MLQGPISSSTTHIPETMLQITKSKIRSKWAWDTGSCSWAVYAFVHRGWIFYPLSKKMFHASTASRKDAADASQVKEINCLEERCSWCVPSKGDKNFFYDKVIKTLANTPYAKVRGPYHFKDKQQCIETVHTVCSKFEPRVKKIELWLWNKCIDAHPLEQAIL
jgi:hypothetical protein